MFLHPSRFKPNLEVLRLYLATDEAFSVVRFSAHDASHDRRIRGLTPGARRTIVDLLQRFGPVLVSTERDELRLHRSPRESVPVAPEHFHDLLANATVFVGDSQSVAAEAAILGVPALRLSGFTGKVFYLSILEEAGLMRNFLPGEEGELLLTLERHLEKAAERRERCSTIAAVLNDSSEDLLSWYLALIEECRSP